MNRTIVVAVLAIMIISVGAVSAQATNGQPFQELWDALQELSDTLNDRINNINDTLNDRIDNIELTPGPQGPAGLQGEVGPAGPPQPAYPVSLVMDGARTNKYSISNMNINGRKITGPLSPGQSVTVDFDWSRQRYDPNYWVLLQLYVGFAGTESTCVAHGWDTATGHSSVTLTAPDTLGTHVIAIRETADYNCISNLPISTEPANAAYAAVTAVN